MKQVAQERLNEKNMANARPSPNQIPEHLTRREKKVLELICQGHDQETIASMLNIMPATVETHQKRIRGKLGVHSERDIPLAAYQASLFSTLDECKDT